MKFLSKPLEVLPMGFVIFTQQAHEEINFHNFYYCELVVQSFSSNDTR